MPLFSLTRRSNRAAAARSTTTRPTTARQPASRPTSAACTVEGLEGRTVFNGTLATAVDLGTLYGQVQKTDSVSAAAPVDYFKFKLAYTGKVTARLTNLTANADLRLIRDANGNGVADASEVLAVSANGGTSAEQIIKAPIGPGTFFFQVKRVANTPSYKLTVKSDYAGQDFPSAHTLGTFTGTKTRADRVDGDDPSDFYKIVLTSTKTISATLSGTGDANLELAVDTDHDGTYDDGQDFIHRSNNPGTSNENLGFFTLGPGTYFIKVFSGTADAQYTVNIKVS
jgi:serine protease